MENCSICKKEIEAENPYVILYDNNGDGKEICSECEKQISTIVESNDANEIRSIMKYLHSYINKIDDKEVVSYIYDILESNSEMLCSMKDTQEKGNSENVDIECEYLRDDRNDFNFKDISFWISVVRGFAWMISSVIIIAGFVIVVNFGIESFIGLLIILGSVVLAIINVALGLVFADMAENIIEIKDKL